MPFFSIIIPVYNVAPYLRECLDSILAQTFTDWEAICVDDGSTDNSGAILDEYAAKDNRFRVIHQPNAGVGAARNKGLNIAKGNRILFLDADDVWQHNLLSTVVSMIKAHPDEKLFRFGYECFKDKFNVNQIDRAKEGCTVIDISKEISMHDFFFFFFFCYAYRRDVFDGIRFPRYIRGEDRWVLNKIQLERANVIVATDCKLYGYRKRMGSAMNTVPSMQVLCDEMDHRLDIMGMIDASHKKVVYARNGWLERYFTKVYPLISFERSCDVRAVRQEWYDRLPRLLELNGLSLQGRMLIALANSHVLRPIGYLIIFVIPYLRSRLASIESVARFYRRIMRHGEFAHK